LDAGHAERPDDDAVGRRQRRPSETASPSNKVTNQLVAIGEILCTFKDVQRQDKNGLSIFIEIEKTSMKPELSPKAGMQAALTDTGREPRRKAAI
jgi:hypothetical protein